VQAVGVTVLVLVGYGVRVAVDVTALVDIGVSVAVMDIVGVTLAPTGFG